MPNIDYLLKELSDPINEVDTVRAGLKTTVIDSFLETEQLVVKDVLARLDIPASTYFAKKKNHLPLDSHSTEKFIRLITVVDIASKILGAKEAHDWIFRQIPSLGNEEPINLLDTEAGHRLVVQALLHIKHGVYS